MILYHQEQVFRDSFIVMSGLKEPVAPVEQDPESLEKYQIARQKFDAKVDQAIQIAIQE